MMIFKNKIIKILNTFLVILFVILAFSFINLKVYATATANGEYREEKELATKTLEYGLKYRSVQGASRGSTTASFVPQVCNYIEIPANEGLLVTTWSNFQPDAWKRGYVDVTALKFEETHPGYRVIAVANGDFFDIHGEDDFPYSTTGTVISGGNFFKATPTRKKGYKVVSFTNDGTENSLIGYDQSVVNVDSLPTLAIYDENDQIIKEFSINKVNEAPGENEISVYFGTFKNKVYNEITTDKNAKKTYIVSNPNYCLPNSKSDFYGLGVIDKCLGSIMLEQGKFAISSNNAEVDSYLGNGIKIRVQYQWNGEAENVKNALNAGTQVLVNGEAPSNVNTADGSRMEARHPRTAIGVKKDGTLVLMVNDGRQEKDNRYGSYGNELAAMMKHYGCVNAFNLDGGGSSIMYYRDGDTFVSANKYSDGKRSVSNVLLIAVKDPELDVDFSKIGSKEITINVDLINNNNHDVKDLYAIVGTKTAKVENGKVTISNLSPLTKYQLQFYYENSKGGTFYIPIKYEFGTKSREYRFKDIDITIKEDKYIFELDYSDQAKATTLNDAIIYINGKSYQMKDGKVEIDKNDFDIIKEIKLEFKNQIIDGYETVVLINPHAPYLNDLTYLFDKINQMIDDIFN